MRGIQLKNVRRKRRGQSVRRRIRQYSGRPRLSVFRSSKHFSAQVIDDEQVKAQNLFVEYPHASRGSVRSVGFAAQLSATPPSRWRAAPEIGQHTEEILRESGYSDGEIQTLLTAGAARGPG